jgi:hypothetical protein
MSNSVYTWRPRTEFKVDAQVAGEELAKIKGHNSGDLTPEMVVKAAQDVKSPLHAVFEWDDAKAAQEQRLTQARLLIRSVVVTVTPANDSAPQPVSATLTSAPGGTGSAHVVTEAELHQAKVKRGWDGLDQWLKTYGALPEFAQVAGVLGALMPKESKAA